MQERCCAAYGSNLNIREMRARCPKAAVLGTALIPGHRLVFKKCETGTYLSIEKAEGFSAPAAVWEVTEADERALDLYERYPELYYKKEVMLSVRNTENGEISDLTAFVYIMQEKYKPWQPTDAYFKICAEGYREFGFDERILREAYAYSMTKV